MKTTSAMTELCSDFVFIPAKRHIAHSCDAQRSEAVVRNPDVNGESREPRRRRRHGRTLDICDVLPAVLVRRVSELMVVVGLLLAVRNSLIVGLYCIVGRSKICWVLRNDVPPGQRGLRHVRSLCDR